MDEHEHAALLERVEALEEDVSFATKKCEEGMHTVIPVVREYLVSDGSEVGSIISHLELFLSCPYCDRLFGLMGNPRVGAQIIEIEVDREKLAEARREAPFGEMKIEYPDEGEVIEAELLDDDDDNEDGGGLHRF